jgi:hypothetical protein
LIDRIAALSVPASPLTTGFIAPSNVDEFLARFPKVIPSFVRIRTPQASPAERAEIVSRLEEYLRTPSALMGCPDRIALFGHSPGSGEPTQRFFRWVWMCLNGAGVTPLLAAQDAASLRPPETDSTSMGPLPKA